MSALLVRVRLVKTRRNASLAVMLTSSLTKAS